MWAPRKARSLYRDEYQRVDYDQLHKMFVYSVFSTAKSWESSMSWCSSLTTRIDRIYWILSNTQESQRTKAKSKKTQRNSKTSTKAQSITTTPNPTTRHSHSRKNSPAKHNQHTRLKYPHYHWTPTINSHPQSEAKPISNLPPISNHHRCSLIEIYMWFLHHLNTNIRLNNYHRTPSTSRASVTPFKILQRTILTSTSWSEMLVFLFLLTTQDQLTL